MNACIILPESSINESNTQQAKASSRKQKFFFEIHGKNKLPTSSYIERSKTIYYIFCNGEFDPGSE